MFRIESLQHFRVPCQKTLYILPPQNVDAEATSLHALFGEQPDCLLERNVRRGGCRKDPLLQGRLEFVGLFKFGRQFGDGGLRAVVCILSFALNLLERRPRGIDAAVDIHPLLRLTSPSVFVGKRISPDLLKKRKAEILKLLPGFRRRNLFVCEVHDRTGFKDSDRVSLYNAHLPTTINLTAK
jgi:hypothetical protein